MRYEKSVELLGRAARDEHWAINQYLYFHFHCEDQGLDILAALFLRTAQEEMGHLAKIAERIIYLGGDVEMTSSHAVKKITGVNEMLATARELEEMSIRDYNQWALDVGPDSQTRKLFEYLVAFEERHFNQYDDEAQNISRYGESYLSQQVMERSRSGATRPPDMGNENIAGGAGGGGAA